MILSLNYSRIIAALEDRIKFLVKKFPSVPEETIRFLSKCDPAGGKYLEYLVSQRAKGNLVGEGDDLLHMNVYYPLSFYMMVNQSKRVKAYIQSNLPELDIPDDISRIDFNDLSRLAGKYYSEVKDIVAWMKKKREEYTHVVYEDNTYKIITFVWDPATVKWDELVDEICAYGKGKWCTQNKGAANEYLEFGNGLYIVFKDGKSLLQTDGKEFKDVYNRNFSFFGYTDLALLLMKLGIIKLYKATPTNPDPNKKFLGDLSYYMDLKPNSDPIRQYLVENNFV